MGSEASRKSRHSDGTIVNGFTQERNPAESLFYFTLYVITIIVLYRICYLSIPLWRRSEETLSFLRPLRRRAFNTLRPLEEAIRLRKPCLLRRFRTEG